MTQLSPSLPRIPSVCYVTSLNPTRGTWDQSQHCTDSFLETFLHFFPCMWSLEVPQQRDWDILPILRCRALSSILVMLVIPWCLRQINPLYLFFPLQFTFLILSFYCINRSCRRWGVTQEKICMSWVPWSLITWYQHLASRHQWMNQAESVIALACNPKNVYKTLQEWTFAWTKRSSLSKPRSECQMQRCS